VKLVANEAINSSIAMGLGKGVTQSDVLSLTKKTTYVKLKKMPTNDTSRSKPPF
jgi:hypothetical protein